MSVEEATATLPQRRRRKHQHVACAQAEYTPGVCTAWYRSPEVMLGAKAYGPAMDMWACGCIMAELMLHETLFNGRSELEMLKQFCDLLGAPTEKTWPGFRKLPGARVSGGGGALGARVSGVARWVP